MEKQSREIIILGAGLAGLTLAYQLKKSGIDALVLEARDRIGGRIHTIENGGTTLELGATWFADKHVNLINLLIELGIEKIEQAYGKYGIYELADGEKQLFEMPPQPEATYRVKGGTSTLINAFFKTLDSAQIQLDQIIREVNYQGGLFRIQTEKKEQYLSQYLISTLPPTLMVNSIVFSPNLPDSLTSIARQTHTWMGESLKVGFFSPTPFWLEKGIGTFYSQKGPLTEFYDHSNEYGFAMKGFMHDGFVTLPKAEREKAVRAQLTNIFGEDNCSEITYQEEAWRDQKFTHTNYKQPVAPHQNNGNTLLREPLFNGQMFMAGSEVAPSFPGYMDGAVEAAGLVANELILELTSSTKA